MQTSVDAKLKLHSLRGRLGAQQQQCATGGQTDGARQPQGVGAPCVQRQAEKKRGRRLRDPRGHHQPTLARAIPVCAK
ncbi:hypothetical protein G6F64_015129 [Rhizopus arrhizus]|uniref:Uncharacterized protein n=1 Tax=Rhizopus oryzae TaxID=64495 RepID=A0A9P6WS60_RHIOR|nr:hypothetical protein G6F64_015129 [Rhizopus arrhizus]